jgi:hypothetical protein
MYQKNDGTTRKVLRPPERVGTDSSTRFSRVVRGASACRASANRLATLLVRCTSHALLAYIRCMPDTNRINHKSVPPNVLLLLLSLEAWSPWV